MSSFGSLSSSLKIAFGVSGSGEAKISASRIAFSSALASLGPCSCPSSPSCLSNPFFSSMGVLGIANRVRGVGGPRTFVDADRAEAARLEHANELEPDHFQQREKRHDEAGAIVHVGEQ